MSFLTTITKLTTLCLGYLNREIIIYLYSFPQYKMSNMKMLAFKSKITQHAIFKPSFQEKQRGK